MTHDEKQPPEAAAEPVETLPERQRRRHWLGLTALDWGRLVLVLAIGAVIPTWLLAEAPRGPLTTSLALALASLAGAALSYIILRRQPSELDQIAERVAELQRSIVEVEAQHENIGGHFDELEGEAASLRTRGAQLAEEIQTLQARPHSRLVLDATDQQILTLLTEDPTTTDDEIGRHPKVRLERSQVTRRRQRLAAAGYTAAQKRQGQRPSKR